MKEKKNINRRDFLKETGGIIGKTLAIPVLAGLAMGEEQKTLPSVTPTLVAPEYKIPSAEKKELVPIEKRVLGRTGMQLTAVSMGVMNCSDPAVLLHAFDLGINFFDTADCYQGGRNEEMVGNTLVGNPAVRSKIFVQTKLEVGDEKSNQDSVDRSLRRLKTDHIDSLVWHGLDTVESVNDEKLISFMEKQKKSGKARFIGFSTHSNMDKLIRAAVQNKKYDVILTVYNHTSPPALREAIKMAAEAGIGIIAMKTQSGGKKKREQLSVFQHQLLLKSVLADKNVTCAIPGVVATAQIENLAEVGRKKIEMDKNDLDSLQKLRASLRNGTCTICGECIGDCPFGVLTKDAMRSALYLESYGNFDLAKQTLTSAFKNCPSLYCLDCSKCQVKCARYIDIKNKIIETYQMLI